MPAWIIINSDDDCYIVEPRKHQYGYSHEIETVWLGNVEYAFTIKCTPSNMPLGHFILAKEAIKRFAEQLVSDEKPNDDGYGWPDDIPF